MAEAAEKTVPMQLSGKFSSLESCPLTREELVEGCCEYDGDIVKAGVSISENGGASRIRVRPTIKEVGDSSALAVADQLNEIAWADCMKHGKKRRYVTDLVVREDGLVLSQPIRIYFTLEPEVDHVEESTRTDTPSLEYVRGLEQINLRNTDRLSRMSCRVMAQEESRHKLAWAAVTRAHQATLAEGQVKIATIEAQGRNTRNDKLLDGAISMLPALAARYLPGVETPAALTSEKTPFERVRDLVSEEQFEKMKTALGDELVEKFEACKTIEAARELLAGLPADKQHAMADAIGDDNIFAMAAWK